jgi:hypothetical protein
MGQDKKTPISIDGVEYILEEMTVEQQLFVNHIADLERKIGTAQFNLDQLQVGKQAFVQILKENIAAAPEETEAIDTVQ